MQKVAEQSFARAGTAATSKAKLAAYLAAAAIPLIVIALIWVPIVSHFAVRVSRPDLSVVNASRQNPADAVLSELKDFRYLEVKWPHSTAVVNAADNLLQGRVEIPGYAHTSIHLPFDPADLDSGLPPWQLQFAGMIVPDTLLQAYEVNQREEYFEMAKQIVRAMCAHERKSWLPEGLFWNDHAVANRVVVLTNFWRIYRHHSSFDPELASEILQSVYRDTALLAKPEQFTYATNHGVMQNLGLLHAAVAFPDLMNSRSYVELAASRLDAQLKFYISDEGVVLEHSAGYQLFGVELIGMGVRYLQLLGKQVPPDWRTKYERAKSVYSVIRRPDGSLPLYGDTFDETDAVGPRTAQFLDGEPTFLRSQTWQPAVADFVAPISGYAVAWTGLSQWPNSSRLTQTVICWSNVEGHGHKHADDLSVLFWAGGANWWTNAGYWPYGLEGRAEAESWSGSNAPHLPNEASDTKRRTRLLATAQTAELQAFDLERYGPYDHHFRRQVIRIAANLWLVLDSNGSNAPAQSIWTTAVQVGWKSMNALNSFNLSRTDTKTQLATAFAGAHGTTFERQKGSFKPFAGWHVVNGEPTPASAMIVQQPVGGWAAVAWTVSNAPVADFQVAMTKWSSPEDWSMKILTGKKTVSVERRFTELTVDNGQTRSQAILRGAPNVQGETDKLGVSLQLLSKQYPRFKSFLDARIKLTRLFVLLFVGQELLFGLIWVIRKRTPLAAHCMAATVWIGVGVWILGFYLRG